MKKVIDKLDEIIKMLRKNYNNTEHKKEKVNINISFNNEKKSDIEDINVTKANLHQLISSMLSQDI